MLQKLGIAAGAALIASSALAADVENEQKRFYVGASAGLTNMGQQLVIFTPSFREPLNYDNGINLELSAGYRATEFLRFQTSLEYTRNAIDNFGPIEFEKGDFSQISGSVSAFIDYQLTDKLTPFVGAGFGVGSYRIGKVTPSTTPFIPAKYKVRHKAVPFVKLSAGAAYSISNHIDLTAQYDFVQSRDFNYTIYSNKVRADYTAQHFKAGLRYNF